ncbi:hypothetical protein B0H15DRAFT_50052 [Mycena belliarum]|uniref:Uncharacterized protein n=1 Tax=Mycena belliarum TaxID=1033014 RepID=A0AAD6XSJ6_9AGAR|nr:hypothetical protein B0H15DRAFT_50052 [Mycena belliae]
MRLLHKPLPHPIHSPRTLRSLLRLPGTSLPFSLPPAAHRSFTLRLQCRLLPRIVHLHTSSHLISVLYMTCLPIGVGTHPTSTFSSFLFISPYTSLFREALSYPILSSHCNPFIISPVLGLSRLPEPIYPKENLETSPTINATARIMVTGTRRAFYHSDSLPTVAAQGSSLSLAIAEATRYP